jgi:hypothetical protein
MRYHVEIPLGTPPGRYNLTVSVLDAGSRRPRFVIEGVPVSAERTEAVVGHITVEAEAPEGSALREGAASQGTWLTSDGLLLLGCETTMDNAFVGETLVLYPLWSTEGPTTATTYDLQLVNDAQEVALTERYLLSPRYPPAQWQPGSVVRDRLEIPLPAQLSAGAYTWVIQVDGREARVGALDVRVPVRERTVPPGVEPVGEVLGGFAELAGYRLEDRAPSEPLRVVLYWRAREQTGTNYKVFLHLLDAEGRVVAQSDAVPAAWARPTTSWLPPEVIEDGHLLRVPPDLAPSSRLIVGLYEPATGHRATGAAGIDHIVLEMDSGRSR